MSFIKKSLYKFVLVAYTFFSPIVSLAQTTVDVDPCSLSGKICNPIKSNTIMEFIHTFLVGALKIGIPVIVLAIIYSGLLFVMARGNEEKLTKAKDALLYTLIGAGVLLGSWAMAEFIKNTVEAF